MTEAHAAAMRILVEHGSTEMDNLGDIAMLQVAVARLRAQWPDSEINVVVRGGESLALHVPSCVPVKVTYPAAWVHLRRLLPWGSLHTPAALRLRFEAGLSRILPASYKRRLAEAVEAADAVVHAGAGILADPFLPAALRRLDLFEHALQLGKPAALFGQGVGPVSHPELRDAVQSTLARVDKLSVRDAASARLLAGLLDRTEAYFPESGDDALALAFAAHREPLGESLGLNLRLAPYSGVAMADLDRHSSLTGAIVPWLQRAGVMISPFSVRAEDAVHARALISQWTSRDVDGGHPFTVPGLLEAIANFRLVITGSYHGAVLALGQGIPAVCLYRSEYYRRKFTGLARQFPQSCLVLDLANEEEMAGLAASVDTLWNNAESRRPALLEAVARHVQHSQTAYDDWFAVVERGQSQPAGVSVSSP